MNTPNKIEQLITKFCQMKSSAAQTSADLDKKILNDALYELNSSRKENTNLLKVIFQSRLAGFAAAAVIILVLILSLNRSTAPAWAIEQTVEALDSIESVVISGTDRYAGEYVPFKFWFRFDDKNTGWFDMRYASDRQIVVVKGTSCWAYWPLENTVKIYQDVTTSQGMMRDLSLLYDIAELNPWITAKLLATLKSCVDDWQETYATDEKTGRDCVFVTCSYKPLSISVWFVCDIESKLIIEGKFWRNVARQGPPETHAVNFSYNESIPEETFNFQIPQSAKIIKAEEQDQARELFNKGEKLFQQKDYQQAIEIYQQVYQQNTQQTIGEEALMMVGICYRKLGNRDKAVETYRKCISEYPNLRGWIEATYFYLGREYFDAGQKEKALEAFTSCLIMGQGVRDPDKFPLKDAREYIEKIKNPEAATNVNQQEQDKARTLFNSGEKLFQKKEFDQAIKIYQQVYEQNKQSKLGVEALEMVGICYSNLGQIDMAVETFEKCVREYPDQKGWIVTTWFYLGEAYIQAGQKEKALEAFKSCLIAGQGVRSPSGFPLKDAREYIEKLENQK